MWLPIVLLLLITCQTSISIGVYNEGVVSRKDSDEWEKYFHYQLCDPRQKYVCVGARSQYADPQNYTSKNCDLIFSFVLFENAGFRSGVTHAEFGERVRDWFRNLKDRLFGKKVESSASNEKELINLDKADIQDRVRNSGGFFVDLSRLTFDPKYDIGFRIGRWYFIRIRDKIDDEFGYNDSREWDMSASLGPDQFTHQVPNDDWLNDDFNKMLDTTFPPSTTETTLTTEEVSTESDSFESGTTEVPKREEDNETGGELDLSSAQVILP